MHSLKETESPKRGSTNWTPLVAIVLAIISMAVSGLVSYGKDQTDLKVKSAISSAISVSQTDLQPFRDKNSEMATEIGVLKSQRTEDRDRLIRIEDKLDRVLSVSPPLRARSNIPPAQAAVRP